MKCAVSGCFLLALSLSLPWLNVEAKKKKPKIQVSISEPRPELAPVIKNSSQDAASSAPAVPKALFGDPEESLEEENNRLKFPPIDFSFLKTQLEAGDFVSLSRTIEFWLTVRNDLHSGERFRLELLWCLSQAYAGHVEMARAKMLILKKYLSMLSVNLKSKRVSDRIRHLNIQHAITLNDIESLGKTQ